MGMTMTQKILAAHAGLDHVEAGQLILVNLDRVLGNDITSPVAIREFNKLGTDHVFDKDKVTMVMDHFAPNKDIKAATQCKMCRDFCNEKEVTHFYDVGQMGIEHALLPEKGLVVSGDVVIGADSHTCTYGALGAFSTGVGSTDMACGMAIGKAWFKVPSAIQFELKGKLNPYISGKDVILHIIGMIFSISENKEFEKDNVAEKMEQAKIIMNENVCKEIDPEELAEKLNISYSWFRKTFKKYTGYSPAKYFQELKLRKAKQILINTSYPVKEICFMIGYTSTEHFSNLFKKNTGLTPLEYRSFGKDE